MVMLLMKAKRAEELQRGKLDKAVRRKQHRAAERGLAASPQPRQSPARFRPATTSGGSRGPAEQASGSTRPTPGPSQGVSFPLAAGRKGRRSTSARLGNNGPVLLFNLLQVREKVLLKQRQGKPLPKVNYDKSLAMTRDL